MLCFLTLAIGAASSSSPARPLTICCRRTHAGVWCCIGVAMEFSAKNWIAWSDAAVWIASQACTGRTLHLRKSLADDIKTNEPEAMLRGQANHVHDDTTLRYIPPGWIWCGNKRSACRCSPPAPRTVSSGPLPVIFENDAVGLSKRKHTIRVDLCTRCSGSRRGRGWLDTAAGDPRTGRRTHVIHRPTTTENIPIWNQRTGGRWSEVQWHRNEVYQSKVHYRGNRWTCEKNSR